MVFWLLFSNESIQNILILSATVSPFAYTCIRPVVNWLNQDTMVYYGLVLCLFSWPYMVKWHTSGIIKQFIQNKAPKIILQWNPALQNTRFIWTSVYLSNGQLRLSRLKAHILSLKITHLIQTPDIFPCPKSQTPILSEQCLWLKY